MIVYCSVNCIYSIINCNKSREMIRFIIIIEYNSLHFDFNFFYPVKS